MIAGYTAVLVALAGLLVLGSLALERRPRLAAWWRWRARRPRFDSRDLDGFRRQLALWKGHRP